MNTSRRDFLYAAILGTPAGLAAVELKNLAGKNIAESLGILPAKLDAALEEPPKKEGLEKITDDFNPPFGDGWYIQYSFNKDPSYVTRNKADLHKIGFTNVYQIPENGATTTLIGKYSSMQEAVQDTNRLSGLVKEVGIIYKKGDKIDWSLTASLLEKVDNVSLNDINWNNMPAHINSLVDKLTLEHNGKSSLKLNPDWIKAILTAENSQYDPNKVSYKFSVITKDKKHKVLVRKKDKAGNYIPTAYGLMMLSKETMDDMRLDFKDRFDSSKNLRAGIGYFGKLLERFDGDLEKSFAAYNAGPGAVSRYNGVPPFEETRKYVKRIWGNLPSN